jgi:hypothetical protein
MFWDTSVLLATTGHVKLPKVYIIPNFVSLFAQICKYKCHCYVIIISIQYLGGEGDNKGPVRGENGITYCQELKKEKNIDCFVLGKNQMLKYGMFIE